MADAARHPTLVRLAVGSAVLFAIQVVIGGAQVLTRLDELDTDAPPGARRGDLGDARRVDRHELLHGPRERARDAAGAGEPASAGADGTAGPADHGRHDPRLHRADQAADHRAPARHDRPGDGSRHARSARRQAGVDWPDWVALVFWTLIGGTLAAGSANAINCYLDRDIDLLMTRTRRRPLPAHEVDPERAVVFGLVLGVISFVVMVYFVNLTRRS